MKRLLFLLVTLVFAACGRPSSTAPTSKPFTLGMVTFAGYAPLYLAKEKGFFGSTAVELKRIEEIPSIRAAVSGGNLDAYLATPDIYLNATSQPPGRAVWAIDESAGGDGVIVGPGIRGLADLKGKQVAAEPGLPPYFVLMYLLHKNGMSINDVKLRDMTTQNAAAAFSSGAVDAAGIYEPYLSTAVKQRQGSRIVVNSAQLPGMIVDLIFASDSAISSRGGDIEAVIAGWRKALAYIRDNHDDAFQIMAKAFGLSVDQFTDTVGGIRWIDAPENQALFQGAPSGGRLNQTMKTVVDVLRRHHPEVHETKPSDAIDGRFVAGITNTPEDKQASVRWVHP